MLASSVTDQVDKFMEIHTNYQNLTPEETENPNRLATNKDLTSNPPSHVGKALD